MKVGVPDHRQFAKSHNMNPLSTIWNGWESELKIPSSGQGVQFMGLASLRFIWDSHRGVSCGILPPVTYKGGWGREEERQ